MAANINDKFSEVSTGTRPTVTTVASVRSVSGSSLVCDDLTGWATDTAVHFVTYEIDGQGNVVPGTQQDMKGIVSGNTIGNVIVTGGTDTGNKVGDIVQQLPTAAWAKDLADGLQASHNLDGSLKAGIVDTTELADEAVTTAKIDDGAVTTAKIDDGAVTPEKQTVRACLASRSFTLANNSTITVGLNTTSYDPEGWLSGGGIVVPAKGLYEIGGYALFASSGGGDLRMITLVVNGSTAREYRNSQGFDSSYAHSVEGSVKIMLNVGDKVELRCFQNSGAALSVDTSLQVEFLGSVVS